MSQTNFEGSSDEEWAARIRAGDYAAFERLFRANYDSLVYFVIGYVRRPEVAEEIVQDVFFNIWRSRRRWNPRGALNAYLFGAARNNSLKYLKRQRLVARIKDELSDLTAPHTRTPDRDVELRDFNRALRRAVDELPDRRRQVFLLSREQGLTYAQIAAVMDISVNTVENQMVKAIKSLRKALASYLTVAALMAANMLQVFF